MFLSTKQLRINLCAVYSNQSLIPCLPFTSYSRIHPFHSIQSGVNIFVIDVAYTLVQLQHESTRVLVRRRLGLGRGGVGGRVGVNTLANFFSSPIPHSNRPKRQSLTHYYFGRKSINQK